jgi:hypothetical protein
MIEATRSSETSVLTIATQRNIPEDCVRNMSPFFWELSFPLARNRGCVVQPCFTFPLLPFALPQLSQWDSISFSLNLFPPSCQATFPICCGWKNTFRFLTFKVIIWMKGKVGTRNQSSLPPWSALDEHIAVGNLPYASPRELLNWMVLLYSGRPVTFAIRFPISAWNGPQHFQIPDMIQWANGI